MSAAGRVRSVAGRYPLLTAVVLLEVAFLSLPTLIILVTSFGGGETIAFPPESYTLQWYLQIPAADPFVTAFVHSAIVAAYSTALAIPVGVTTSLALNRYDIRLENLVQVYLLLPFTVPLVVSGVMLLILFGELGWIGSLWAVGLAITVINIPFMIWSVTASVNSLDPGLEAAAKSLGAEEIHTFLYVTLPSIVPGVITGALLMFVLALNEFLVSLFITTSKTVTLPVKLYSAIRGDVSPFLAAVSSIYVLVALLAIVVADRLVGIERFLHS